MIPGPLGPGFHQRVYDVVRQVPPGRVTTYGDVALAAGALRAARQVGYAMAALTPEHGDVPWHRVINARGLISPGREPGRMLEQRLLLEAEGVAVDQAGKVDLARLRWRGPGAVDCP